jgi:hypothetical protein
MNQLEKIWKKAVVGYFKTLFQHMPGETYQNHGKAECDCRFPNYNVFFLADIGIYFSDFFYNFGCPNILLPFFPAVKNQRTSVLIHSTAEGSPSIYTTLNISSLIVRCKIVGMKYIFGSKEI